MVVGTGSKATVAAGVAGRPPRFPRAAAGASLGLRPLPSELERALARAPTLLSALRVLPMLEGDDRSGDDEGRLELKLSELLQLGAEEQLSASGLACHTPSEAGRRAAGGGVWGAG